MLNKLAYNNLICLKNASLANKSFTDLYYNKLFLEMVNFFYRKGYILGYVFLDAKRIRIYLKYVADKGLLNGLCFYHKTPYFSYKALRYLYSSMFLNNYLYFFSTSKGLCTLDELFMNNYRVGGILYFYIALR